MQDVIDFFRGLFDTDRWPPRWHCGYWSDFHGWLYIIGDLSIWLSYFTIPIIIVGYAVRKKYELRYTNTYILFASFIMLCGTTHLLDAVMFWIPFYRLNALILCITGVVSLFTVYHLIKILPTAFKEKTSLILEREIALRQQVEKQLAAANNDLQNFVYVASHDLQEPLRKAHMYMSRVHEHNDGILDQASVEWINKSIRSTERLQRMIKDVLQLSSIKEAELKATDLNSVVEDALIDLDLKIKDRQATIEIDALPNVVGNREYLVHLFINLLSNAIKFSTEAPEIRITAQVNNEKVLVSVTDNGIGMKEEDIPKIFAPFERLNPTGTFDGAGIGLSIVKKILDLHNATVMVSSTPGKGTTFTISFQAAERRV